MIGAAVIISTLFALWTLSSVLKELEAVEVAGLPAEMVLYLEIDGDLPDQAGEANFSQPLAKNTRTLKNYIDALERAGKDPRVKGVYATLGDGSLSVAHAQEFRKALAAYKKSGKFSYIYAPAFDQGMGGYYLASAFDEMWMQPMGIVMVSGSVHKCRICAACSIKSVSIRRSISARNIKAHMTRLQKKKCLKLAAGR